MLRRRSGSLRFGSALLSGTLLLIQAGFSAAAAAVPYYSVHLWQMEDGLPHNSVTATLQTRDGYLWLGTYNGLARFDGARFTVFDDSNTPEMSSSRVTSLFEAADGTLWIGNEGGEVTRFKNERFEPVDFRPNWTLRKVFGIGEDESGDIWLVNPDGLLSRLKDGRTITPPAGGARGVVKVTNSRGTIWVAREGTVSALEHGQLRTLDLGGEPDGRYVQGMCSSADGGLWIAYNGIVQKWRNQKWAERWGDAPWTITPITAMIETRAGVLAAGTADKGLYLLTPQGEVLHFASTNGLRSDWVRSLWEDREGNLWVGTRNGLAMLRTSIVGTVGPPDQWQGNAVLTVCSGRDGALWAGTEGAGVYRFKHGQWAHFGTAEGLPTPYIWSVSEDAQGLLWGVTWGSGAFVQRGDRFERVPGLDYQLPTFALLHTRPGELWLGTAAGLLHYEDGKTNWIVQQGSVTVADVRAIARDAEGTVWIGMFGGGLGRFKDGQLRAYRKADGLASDFVQCLRPDGDGSLWIGTLGGGLSRLKQGHFATIGRNQGLPNNVICHIEEDRHGFFWMSSHGGIIRVNKAELNRCADGLTREANCQSYGINDGMPTIECSGGLQPAGCQTADGALWFPTSKALVTIDPENVKTNLLPPPVVIEKLLIDDHTTLDAGASPAPLQIPPGRHRFEFRFTGLSFIAPERVRFKYRLDGFEREWIYGDTKRSAHYSYIPPGSYAFQVTACNNDGVWNDTGAQLAFTVLPHFWQTLWFRLLGGVTMAIASGGIVWLDTRRRMRRKLERLERQRAIEQERARIAHDIHDDLGVHLTRISMLSDPGRADLDGAASATGNLKRIHQKTRELTRAMDEIVWAVNPQHDTFESLVSYLHKFAEDFLESTGIPCRLAVPFQLPSWSLSAEVRHNVFLAFKEALNNIARHAAASEVHIALTLEPAAFALAIEDNGRGFVTGTAGATDGPEACDSVEGNGLRNMRLRLEAIGGRCEVRSSPGKGTTVTFFLPVEAAPA